MMTEEQIRVGSVKLTRRQSEVLRCAAMGMSLEESGRQMFISPKTVKVYRSMILERLKAKNMSHAIAMWLTDDGELPCG